MPQLVRSQPLQPRSGRRSIEDVPAKVQVPQDRATAGGKDEVAGSLPSHHDREVVDKKPRDRNRPDLMRLRCAPDQLSPDLADSLDDTEPATHQVNATNLQPRQLAPAQTTVREQQHRGPVVACCLCELAVSYTHLRAHETVLDLV